MRVLLFILLLFPFFLEAHVTHVPPSKRFSIGLSVLPAYTSGIISRLVLDIGVPTIITEEIDGKFGYGIGIDGGYRLSHKLRIKTGIHYFSHQFFHKMNGLQFDSDYDPGGNHTTSRLENNVSYTYLEVPLLIRYEISFDKMNIFFGGGGAISYNISGSGDGIIYYGNGTEEKINSATKVYQLNGSAMFSAGIDYYLSDRINIFLAPTFKINLRPEPYWHYMTRFYALGVNVGVNLNLGK